MPYILQEQRPELDAIIDKFPELNDGQLNYVFTKLAHHCVVDRGLRYVVLNAIVGVFESAKAEFQRRVVAPYEDEKLRINGSIGELDVDGV